MLPCLHSAVRVFVLLAMLNGAIYLRLKSYLVVKYPPISSIALKYAFSQWCFAAQTASGCWHGKLESDCPIRKFLVPPGLTSLQQADLPTWDMKKNHLFLHFSLTETHRFYKYSLLLCFSEKRFSALSNLLAIKTVSKIVGCCAQL